MYSINTDFDVLIDTKTMIEETIIKKIKTDIANETNVKLCIIPHMNTMNIYIDDNRLLDEILAYKRHVIHYEIDYDRKYYYMNGTLNDYSDQVLIDIFKKYKYTNDIKAVPVYLLKHSDHFLKYKDIL
jgi:hypothetical protein